MTKTLIGAGGGAYSPGLDLGDFVFLAGQGGADPTTGELPEGIEAQAEQALRNVESLLGAAGLSLERRRLLPRPSRRPRGVRRLQHGLAARLRRRAAPGADNRRRAAPERHADRSDRDREAVVNRPVDIELPGESHPYYVVDVFTDTPLEGNQLGVFTDGRPFSTEQMQRIARELNVSETVFLLPPEQGGDARIRIFTPSVELPFAGHPILGSAFVVGEALGRDEVALETAKAAVSVRSSGAAGVFGWMEQPPFRRAQPYERADELLAALGVEESLLPVEVYENGPRHVYVRLPDEDAVAALEPDLAALAGHERVGATASPAPARSWKTRMFGPALGVAEDPATGSAAGPLAVHLGRHGVVPWGTEIEIRQGAEIGRPSVLHARAHERASPARSAAPRSSSRRGRYRVS